MKDTLRPTAPPDAQNQQITLISSDHLADEALGDLLQGLLRGEVWGTFALHEIRQRFRRSVLGPFWLTASMGIFVAALGLISSTVFKQDVGHTLPYIATGVIFWNLLTISITEGSTVFISREGYIRNVPLPLSLHLYQMLARNLIIWAFNMVIYVITLMVFRIALNVNILLFLLGGPLFLLNLAWMALAAGILSTRFRDIPQVIQSAIQVIFWVTPVFWSAETMPSRPAFVQFNPLFHLLEIVRAPLLGTAPHLMSWAVAAGLAVVGCLGTALLYRRAYARIAYWV
jgi:ABC-type polysaccharide/polyol phosphate export permease